MQRQQNDELPTVQHLTVEPARSLEYALVWCCTCPVCLRVEHAYGVLVFSTHVRRIKIRSGRSLTRLQLQEEDLGLEYSILTRANAFWSSGAGARGVKDFLS